MENSAFKDFKYVLIDSAVADQKEVLVTYLYNDKLTRQYIFVKEVKGRNESYYINKAKEIIDERIKSGKLVKTSKKQSKIAHTGGKKPVLVALSSVLAAGALATGGYFLGSYLGDGTGGGNNGITVVLNSGDTGYFNESKSVLVIENVTKGTKLGKIAGYLEPTSKIDQDFNYWFVDGAQEIEINQDYVIEASTYLNASYKDTPASARYKAKNEIKDFYYHLVEGLPADSEKIGKINSILLSALSGDSPLNYNDIDIIDSVNSITKEAMLGIVLANGDVAEGYIINAYNNVKSNIMIALGLPSPIRAYAYATYAVSFGKLLLKEPDLNVSFLQPAQSFIADFVRERSESQVEIATPVIRGFLTTSSVIDKQTGSQFYDALLSSFNVEIKFIDECKQQYKDIDTKTLSEFVNSYYLILSKLDKFDSEAFNIITAMYNAVKNDYIVTFKEGDISFYQQSLSKLNKLSLDALANLESVKSDFVIYAAKGISKAIDEFKMVCKEYGLDVKDDTTKISVFYDIYKSAIIGISKLPTNTTALFPHVVDLENDPGILRRLINIIAFGSFNDNDQNNFVAMVLKAIENMDVKYNSYGGGFDILLSILKETHGFLSDVKNADGDAPLMNTLIEGYIASSVYSGKLWGNASNTRTWFYDLVEQIKKKDTTTNPNEIKMVSQFIEFLARMLGNGFKAMSVDEVVGKTLVGGLSAIELADKNIFFNVFSDYKIYDNLLFIGESVCIGEITRLFSYPESLAKGSITSSVFKNGLEFSHLLFSSDNLIKCENADGSLNWGEANSRLSLILPHLELRLDYDSYDVILGIWQESLFNQVTPTTSLDKVTELVNSTVKLIQDL